MAIKRNIIFIDQAKAQLNRVHKTNDGKVALVLGGLFDFENPRWRLHVLFHMKLLIRNSTLRSSSPISVRGGGAGGAVAPQL